MERARLYELRCVMNGFTHYSKDGKPEMVDVSGKSVTLRMARASGSVHLREETIEMIENNLLPKGDPFDIARTAGIMAAKKTSDLIPLCHPLMLSFVDIKLEINRENNSVFITSEVRLESKTGAEMEALTAVSVAALTIYDMCKAVDKEIVISDIMLIEKRGGKSDFFKPK
jgi:cyclic pyranopterin monophosphate synthase